MRLLRSVTVPTLALGLFIGAVPAAHAATELPFSQPAFDAARREGKPVAIINASQRSVHADASLRLVLETMAARIIGPASITMALLGRGLDAGGIAADPTLSEQLRGAVTALALAGQSSRFGSV